MVFQLIANISKEKKRFSNMAANGAAEDKMYALSPEIPVGEKNAMKPGINKVFYRSY
jgi:hypothetical protein